MSSAEFGENSVRLSGKITGQVRRFQHGVATLMITFKSHGRTFHEKTVKTRYERMLVELHGTAIDAITGYGHGDTLRIQAGFIAMRNMNANGSLPRMTAVVVVPDAEAMVVVKKEACL